MTAVNPNVPIASMTLPQVEARIARDQAALLRAIAEKTHDIAETTQARLRPRITQARRDALRVRTAELEGERDVLRELLVNVASDVFTEWATTGITGEGEAAS